MSRRIAGMPVTVIATVVLAALAVGGGVLIGRATADTHSARNSGYNAGLSDGYFKGLPVGEAQGRREGRALEEGIALPASERSPVTQAFKEGYAAGANDVFAGYDGGWTLALPYVVIIQRASGGITYRLESRVPFKSGISYYLCPNGHGLCQRPLH